MPEPTLSMPKADLEREVGFYLGYGRGGGGGDPEWDAHQAARIASAVKSGIRQFYYPPENRSAPAGYRWSFLSPTVGLTLEGGADSLALPADVGGLRDRVTVDDPAAAYRPVSITNSNRIAVMAAASPGQTGRPEWCATRPLRGTFPDRGQRFELVVFPAADKGYTLRADCYLAPDALTGDRPYAYGGPEHAETLLASVIAAAELTDDDKRAERVAYFLERLAVSVALDRGRQAQLIGYNGDRSDGYGYGRGRRGYGPQAAVVTIDGQEPL